jgi:hypothetical protein
MTGKICSTVAGQVRGSWLDFFPQDGFRAPHLACIWHTRGDYKMSAEGVEATLGFKSLALFAVKNLVCPYRKEKFSDVTVHLFKTGNLS